MQRFQSPLAARSGGAEPRSVVVHANEDWLKKIRDGSIDFFAKLSERLAREAITTRLVATGGAASKMLSDQDHIHILTGQQPGFGRNILHAMPAYVWGFWYLDEVGVNWNSSLRFARFCPDQLDRDKAEYFFNGMSSYMLRENVSRQSQEPRQSEPLAAAAAVIYCQELEGLADRCHYLSTEEMIRTTAEARPEERVYVKIHPGQSNSERRRIMALCAEYDTVTVSGASIHDLSAAAGVVVTQNSAAGFEALMQKKPVITCARSDFWQATLTPRNPDDLRQALQHGAEAMAGFDFAKFLYWFLDRNCLEPQKQEFAERVWTRIAEKAFW